MKVIVTVGMLALALSACTTTKQTNEQAVGMANPASEFCIKQGGKSEIKKNTDGSEYGVCHLSNGQIVEEWDYYRRHNK